MSSDSSWYNLQSNITSFIKLPQGHGSIIQVLCTWASSRYAWFDATFQNLQDVTRTKKWFWMRFLKLYSFNLVYVASTEFCEYLCQLEQLCLVWQGSPHEQLEYIAIWKPRCRKRIDGSSCASSCRDIASVREDLTLYQPCGHRLRTEGCEEAADSSSAEL
jgi:hypothetical protein